MKAKPKAKSPAVAKPHRNGTTHYSLEFPRETLEIQAKRDAERRAMFECLKKLDEQYEKAFPNRPGYVKVVKTNWW